MWGQGSHCGAQRAGVGEGVVGEDGEAGVGEEGGGEFVGGTGVDEELGRGGGRGGSGGGNRGARGEGVLEEGDARGAGAA